MPETMAVFDPQDTTGFGFFALFLLLFLAPGLWIVWYLRIFCIDSSGSSMFTSIPASSKQDRWWLYRVPLCCLLLQAVVLVVRNPGNPVDWIAQLSAGFFIFTTWLGLLTWALPWLGISARDDVAERRNRAASWPIAGAQLGLTLCFMSTVVGHGSPAEVWLALLPGILQTLALLTLWAVLESLMHVSEAITIDRDAGTALRLAGFLVALGLMLGHAYTPPPLAVWKQIVRFGGPIGLLVGALLVESWCKQIGERTFEGFKRKDVAVAAAFVVVAGLCVIVTR
jgi:hypothetical protein